MGHNMINHGILGYHFPDKPIHVRCVYNVFTSGWASSAISMGSAVLGEVRTLIFQRCQMAVVLHTFPSCIGNQRCMDFLKNLRVAPPPFDREWQCPLWSGARGVWLYPLRSGCRLGSGSAHWNLALAVEARQCPLRSGARGWGWSGGRGGGGGGGGGGRGDGRHAALIKFWDFHMAGGEQIFQHVFARKHREFFQDFLRKLAKVYFRHVDAAKETRHIAKGSRKRWRKGIQNRTQSIGVSATAQTPLYSSRADCAVIWVARKNTVSWIARENTARYS